MAGQLFFGLGAMVFWALSDIVAARAVRKSGTIRILFYSQLASVAFALLALPFVSPRNATGLGYLDLLLLAFCGLLNAGGFLFFYQAIEKGRLALAVPLGYSWSIVTALLSVIFLSERPSPLLLLGAALVVLGGVFSELKGPSGGGGLFSDRETYQVILSVGLWGVCYAVFDQVSARTASWFLPVLFLRFFSTVFLLPPFLSSHNRGAPGKILMRTGTIGLFELVATLSYSLGILSGYSSIVAPVAAGAPAVVVAYSAVFFGEKVSKAQLIGIAAVVLGLVVAALAA